MAEVALAVVIAYEMATVPLPPDVCAELGMVIMSPPLVVPGVKVAPKALFPVNITRSPTEAAVENEPLDIGLL